MIERRSFLGLLGVAIAAPAIVKATSLMKLPRPQRLTYDQVSMRWLEEYNGAGFTRVDVLYGRMASKVFHDSNWFLRAIDEQYQAEFGADGAKIGTQLRIRLPADYTVTDGPSLSLQDTIEQQVVLWPDQCALSPLINDMAGRVPDSLTLVAAAVAVAPAVLKTPVTRRFWKLPQHSAAQQED